MKTNSYIHISEEQAAPVVAGLSQLLADLQIFYSNLRGFHWNIKGANFYSLHEAFENYYNEVNEKIDEVAERILQLGAIPEHRFAQYAHTSKVEQTGVVSDGQEALRNILETFRHLLAQERSVLEAAQEAGDEVTAGLMGDYMAAQEKQVWMLVATLS
ncbi:MAG: Dps family protein [Bacteroidales bacterium]|nr:Dps family protein [Bacteroidales bacterium]